MKIKNPIKAYKTKREYKRRATILNPKMNKWSGIPWIK